MLRSEDENVHGHLKAGRDTASEQKKKTRFRVPGMVHSRTLCLGAQGSVLMTNDVALR